MPGPDPLPEWVATYRAVKAAGKIPSTPPSILSPAGSSPLLLPHRADTRAGTISYPSGVDPVAVASWTLSKVLDRRDIVHAPAGMIGLAFDDGPQPPGAQLNTFLAANSQRATRFLIGSRALDNPDVLAQMIANGDHLAVHTWSHHYMTTLTDMQVLGELGWTAQLLFDHSGRVPAFWRPPFGDVDNRVRAIAMEVFGLTTVLWDHDL